MSTAFKNKNLSTVLFSKTRGAILGLLYGNTGQFFYLREIVRKTGVGIGAAQRELKQLSGSGIIKRTARGNQVYYQADTDCPVFKELKGLIIKTVGVADILKEALSPLSEKIKAAFIYGSFVQGTERNDSDVDIMIIGDTTFAEVTSALSDAQTELSREVNPTVYPVKEIQIKIAKNHNFVKTVTEGEKIFLIGDENVIKRLGK
ncbi:nucleotidyltransferase domain-containing protein [bacterium]|nr:nucleotidyltransferase domain-containing protein [bacterium]